MGNIILQLLDKEFVTDLFRKEVLPQFPELREITEIIIEPIKKHVWHTTYHVVFRYVVTFTDINGAKTAWPIYASAHSSEPRKNAFEALKFLWQQNFSQNGLSVPQPLFYSEEFRAVFYKGAEGKLLYRSIKENNRSEIEAGITKAAAWFAKLHQLPTSSARNFNPENSRIATVVPGEAHLLDGVHHRYPEYSAIYQKLYHLFTLREESFLEVAERQWLVHGDAHPENVILTPNNKLVMVDFSDFCLSDFARDLGTFLQQLEYMSKSKIGDATYTDRLKKLFLNSYFDFAKIKPDESLFARINNYYNWTMIRTASFFLFKHDPRPDYAAPLIETVCKNLNLKT